MKRLLALAVTLSAAALSQGQNFSSPDYFFDVVASGLSNPVSMVWVSPDKILVLEKNTGKVKVVQGGSVIGTALDLPVPNTGEEGLLGIILDPNFDSNGSVYLFYSRADADGGDWIDDRLAKYHWNGTTLSFQNDLLTLGPDDRWETPNYHHGGYLRIGPDNKIYLQRGDMARYGSMEMNNDPTQISGCACIYRLNLDGSAPADNPFVGDPNPSVQKMFMYGFRNGYGMTWDDQTGKMWVTENGPEVYDEINIGQSGMNSGWRLIMGPDSRDAEYQQNNFTSHDQNELHYLPGAFYQDPKFSYLQPIGISGIEFFNSRRYTADHGDMLICSTNLGQLMKFDMNANRDGFALTGGNTDGVADNPTEVGLLTWGTGWGATTDCKLGPDGYLYVVGYQLGKIFRIRPKQETIVPASFSMFRGSVVSGDVDSLADSDEDKLIARPGAVFVSSEPPIQIIINATSPFTSPSTFKFTLEANSSALHVRQIISLFNYDTGQYEEVDSRIATQTDSVVDVDVTSNIGRFVEDGTGNVRARVSFRATQPVFVYPYFGRVDRANWTVHQ
jgi:glucose/arabinose dehydrogenase